MTIIPDYTDNEIQLNIVSEVPKRHFNASDAENQSPTLNQYMLRLAHPLSKLLENETTSKQRCPLVRPT